MPDLITIDAGTLTAAVEDRTVTGLLVPFDEECRSNLGRFTVPAGAFTLPADPSIAGLNVEHAREQPIGRATALTDTDRGTVATFAIARTPAGDDALADIAAGRRRHLSAEVSHVQIRDGRAVGGVLFGAALVAKPAFPSATLLAAAADTPPVQDAPGKTEDSFETHETTSDGAEVTTKTTTTEEAEELPDGTTRVTRVTTVVTETTDPDEPAQEGTTPVTTTAPAPAAPAVQPTVPPTLVAQHADRTPRTPQQPRGTSLQELCLLLATAHQTKRSDLVRRLVEEGEQGAVLYGALTDIVSTGTGGLVPTLQQPQWIGEIWAAKLYQRRYIPLLSSAPLTGMQIQGYKWGNKPGVAPWGGNKTPVPSQGVSVTPYMKEINGLAGANDIDRRYRDFSVPEFWDSYFKYMGESYAKQSDQGVLGELLAGATAIPRGPIPTTGAYSSTSPAPIALGWISIVDGALAVLDKGTPDWAIVAKDVWRDMLLTPQSKVLEYLNSSLGLEEGQLDTFRVIPALGTDLPSGAVLVGAKGAATVYELPGSPIRVEGLDMVKGGIDPGLFGYYATVINEASQVVRVNPPTTQP